MKPETTPLWRMFDFLLPTPLLHQPQVVRSALRRLQICFPAITSPKHQKLSPRSSQSPIPWDVTFMGVSFLGTPPKWWFSLWFPFTPPKNGHPSTQTWWFSLWFPCGFPLTPRQKSGHSNSFPLTHPPKQKNKRNRKIEQFPGGFPLTPPQKKKKKQKNGHPSNQTQLQPLPFVRPSEVIVGDILFRGAPANVSGSPRSQADGEIADGWRKVSRTSQRENPKSKSLRILWMVAK